MDRMPIIISILCASIFLFSFLYFISLSYGLHIKGRWELPPHILSCVGGRGGELGIDGFLS